MSSMNVGIVTSQSVVQTECFRPSLKYDDKGLVKAALTALQAANNSLNQKELNEARIKILESNLLDMKSRAEKGANRTVKAIIGALVISLLHPPATLAAITTGIVSRILDGESGWSCEDKHYWLQVELDAEKTFSKTHPEKVGDDKARGEFVYNFIFDHDPGYHIRTHALSGADQCWEANRHIFAEAQAKYDKIAQDKPLPVKEYIYYD